MAPPLNRVHVLPLDLQITHLFYPNLTFKSQVDPDVTPIYHYFYQLLNQRDSHIIHLFQTFHMNNQGYVVVDMDTLEPYDSHVQHGVFTRTTSIFTCGPVVQPLSSLHISLVRPFSLSTTPESVRSEDPQAPIGYTQHQSSSSSNHTRLSSNQEPSEMRDTLLTSQPSSHYCSGHTTSSKESKGVESTVSSMKEGENRIAHLRPNALLFGPSVPLFPRENSNSSSSRHKNGESSSSRCTRLLGSPKVEQSLDSTPLRFLANLPRFLESALRAVPSIVFVRGRVLALSFSESDNFISYLQKNAQDARHTQSAEVRPSTSGAATEGMSGATSLIPDVLDKTTLSFLKFQVASTGDLPLGIAVPGITNVTVDLDTAGEFCDVLISPIVDTIPAAYEFDFFNGYIKPFLDTFPSRLFFEGDLFTFHGVQFKVQRTVPSRTFQVDIPDYPIIYWKASEAILSLDFHSNQVSCISPIAVNDASVLEEWEQQRKNFNVRINSRRDGMLCCRIGQSTRIHQGQPTPLHWVDVLPPSVVNNIRLMPSRLQPFSLMRAIGSLAPTDLLRLMGWSMELENNSTNSSNEQKIRNHVASKVVEEFTTTLDKIVPNKCATEQEEGSRPAPWNCVVCLEDIVSQDKVLQLPCSHVFHLKCVAEWLKRSILCPVCKRDLRDFV